MRFSKYLARVELASKIGRGGGGLVKAYIQQQRQHQVATHEFFASHGGRNPKPRHESKLLPLFFLSCFFFSDQAQDVGVERSEESSRGNASLPEERAQRKASRQQSGQVSFLCLLRYIGLT